MPKKSKPQKKAKQNKESKRAKAAAKRHRDSLHDSSDEICVTATGDSPGWIAMPRVVDSATSD